MAVAAAADDMVAARAAAAAAVTKVPEAVKMEVAVAAMEVVASTDACEGWKPLLRILLRRFRRGDGRRASR